MSAWLLLAVGCGFAGDVGWNYLDVMRRTEEATRSLAALPGAPRAALQKVAYQPKEVEREAAFARGVITKISLPWNDLFKALNATQAEHVQLLGVEPDAEARTIRISAEAQNIPAMLTYVARLESNAYFSSVGLLQHEMRSEGPAPGVPGARGRGSSTPPVRSAATAGGSNVVSFTLAASWRQK